MVLANEFATKMILSRRSSARRRVACVALVVSLVVVFFVSNIHKDPRGNEPLNYRIQKLEYELARRKSLETAENRTETLCRPPKDTTETRHISIPNICSHLPHLSHVKMPSTGLSPSRTTKRAENQGKIDIVMGVPTTERSKTSYVVPTLRSLIDNLSEKETSNVLIVVMIADNKCDDRSAFVRQQFSLLSREFASAVANGLLEIIVPPTIYYPPDLNDTIPTFGDTNERMFWRTKQNLDYAYLMMYCQRRGSYYLQLEDDIITKSEYFNEIMKVIDRQSSEAPNWLMLEFSTLGFIGKLFRTSDLPAIVQFLLIFYKEKPADWLLTLIFINKFCNPEKSTKDCATRIKTYRITAKSPLFQHVGVESSLRGKLQKLKEKNFGKLVLHKAHKTNPTATVSTSLKVYGEYSLEKAYKGDNFFWALLPQPKDWIKFDFKPAAKIHGILIRSGNAAHPEDRAYNATVEVKFLSDEDDTIQGINGVVTTTPKPVVNVDLDAEYYEEDRQEKKLPPKPALYINDCSTKLFRRTTDGFRIVAEFSDAGTAQIKLDCSEFLVESVRIVMHAESENWLILSEIYFANQERVEFPDLHKVDAQAIWDEMVL